MLSGVQSAESIIKFIKEFQHPLVFDFSIVSRIIKFIKEFLVFDFSIVCINLKWNDEDSRNSRYFQYEYFFTMIEYICVSFKN